MDAHWHWPSETRLQLRLPGPPEPLLQRRLLAMAQQLRGTPGLQEIVPGMMNLTLQADPLRLPPSELERLALAAWRAARPQREAARERQLRVRYDGRDLPAACASLGLSAAQLAEAHSAPLYEVACLGFLPGFAYLLGLPPELALPRHATPRAQVPAGAVGIAGRQTGVYPLQSPGGWQLIGQVDAGEPPLFDPSQQPPSWLLPGDRLRFVPAHA